MASPLVRIDLAEQSRDFQRIALHPGFPLLDRFGANASVLRKWLGRFVAEAQWDEQTVRFLWRDDDNSELATAISPVSLEDLRGSLKPEVDTLQAKLNQAAAKTPNERALLAIMKQRFERAVQGDSRESGSFFKVRAGGGWKLVWCWGYDRRHANSARVSLCPKDACRQAFYDDLQTRHRCPRCGTKLRTGGSVAAAVIFGLLLCLVGGIGYLAWDKAGRPGFAKSPASIRGIVVDAVTGNPIAGVSAQLASDPKQTMQSNPRGEFDFSFEAGRPERLQVSAPGYLAESWNPPQGPIPSDPQRIALRGESDVMGLVIELGSDRPIPFPSIRAIGSEHQGTGDEIGLFLLPGVPGGPSEFEVSAKGYQPLRVDQELKPGRSPNLLFALIGAATVKGSVVDVFNKQPVSGAIVKVVGVPGESMADETGSFRRDNLPGTTCRFEVSAPGYLTREFERNLDPAGESTLKFLLRPELTTFDGTVVDSAGAPVSSAKVRMDGIDALATTSAEGRFHFAGVRKGTRRVEASADGYASRTVEVSIPSPSNESVRIVLTGSAMLVGQVMDAVRKTPVKDAEIRLVDGRWKTKTDDRGQFEIAQLPVGTVSLNVVGPGYRSEQTEVKLIDGETKVEVELHGTTVLGGTVASAFDQRPLAGAKVELEGAPTPQTTDAEGRFRFEGVVAGPAKLRVTADGYRSATEECETRADKETLVPFSLHGAAKLTGKVVAEETSQPIAGAEVVVARTDRKWTTDERGEFSQDDWPAAPWKLIVAAKGFLSQELDHDLKEESDAPVTIRLKPPHFVNGIVVDARSEKPVAGARVTLTGTDGSTDSDAEGRFRLEARPANLYEFGVAASGYPSQSFIERPGANPDALPGTAKTIPDFDFKLALKKDSDEAPAPTNEAAPQPTKSGQIPMLTDPPPSAADQFGPSPRKPRDPLEVEFFGIRTKAAIVGFAVDHSGSMLGNRLERATLELLKSVIDLHPKQMYYVAFFDDVPLKMFQDDTNRGETAPVIASPVNKARTYKWIKTVKGGSGTEPESTLDLIAKMDPKSIFLLSDGVFPPLSEPLYDELDRRKISVNTIAFEDQSGQEGLSAIAARTQGRFRFVPEEPIPELYEISLVTRLYEELLEQWFDPKTPAEDARDAHEGLREFCNGQDFGPARNAGEVDRRKAKDQWRRWWVENKLTPELTRFSDDRLQKNLGNQNQLWRWATVEALSQKQFKNGAVFIRKVRDGEEGVRQAARRALTRMSDDDDYGPEENAGGDAIRVAFDKWTDWWHREKYIDGLKGKTDDSLIHDFENPDPKTRRAAVQAAADRKGFSKPRQLIQRLTDSDAQVRQSAYAALVKAAGKDLGPGDCSNLSRCEEAAKSWFKWSTEKVDADAGKLLQLAESFESNHRSDAAANWYRKVVERFPNTESAAKAAAKLKLLSQ